MIVADPVQCDALRDGVGLFDSRRQVVRASGPDAESYLQGQCSQDISTIPVEQCADALLLAPQGKLDAYVRIARQASDAFLIDVEDGFGDRVVDRLNRFRLRVKVDVELTALEVLSLRGPGTEELEVPDVAGLWLEWAWASSSGKDLIASTTEVAKAVDQLVAGPASATRCEPSAWDAVRMELGVPLMGRELDERTIPAEVGLVERCVSFTKGCYTGQELVARIDSRGSNVARRLRGLLGLPDEPENDIEPGCALLYDAKVVGRITSCAWSDKLGRTVGLGLVHRSVEPGAQVAVGPHEDPGAEPASPGNKVADVLATGYRLTVADLPLV